MELLLIRHGRSLGDDERRVEGGGWDAPLTEKGIRQAKLLAKRLKKEGYNFDVLYASPLKRARKVAEIVGDALNMNVTFDKRLEEQHTGIVAGITYEEAQKLRPEPKGGFRSYLPIPQGESIIDQTARVMRFYAELLDKRMDDKVCIVAHGGTVSIMLSVIYGLPLNSSLQKHFFRFRTGDTGVHKLTIFDPHDVLTHFLNDTSHLKDLQ